MIGNNSRLENIEKEQTVQKENPHSRKHSTDRQEISAGTDAPTVTFGKSGLRLVTDLQNCIKAQQSKAYANKVKLSNLQNMAKTLSYIQEHGYDTLESMEGRLAELKGQTSTSLKELKDTEARLRQVNEQIHYTGQYLANKSVYAQLQKSKNKAQFRQENSAKIALYETALKFLKEKAGDGKLPTLQTLKAEKKSCWKKKRNVRGNIIFTVTRRKNWIPYVPISIPRWGWQMTDRYLNMNARKEADFILSSPLHSGKKAGGLHLAKSPASSALNPQNLPYQG